MHAAVPNSQQPTSKMAPAYLRTVDAAAFLGIRPSTLAKQVRKGEGPRRRKIGRAVVYAVSDLHEYMEGR
jgi:predicted DNA-binding transcriptional regulator AlpA